MAAVSLSFGTIGPQDPEGAVSRSRRLSEVVVNTYDQKRVTAKHPTIPTAALVFLDASAMECKLFGFILGTTFAMMRFSDAAKMYGKDS